MKKPLSFFMILCLILSMAGCAGASAAAAPAPETAESVETTAAPAPETAKSAETTAAPVPETTKSVETTAAPVLETAAAPETTEAPVPETAEGKETPAGGYKLTDVSGESGSSLGVVSSVMDLGAVFYLFLEESGSGSLSFLGEEIPLNWDEDSITFRPGKNTEAMDSIQVPYDFSGDYIKISSHEYYMDFTRLTDEELSDYQQNGSAAIGGLAGTLVQGIVGNIEGGLAGSLLMDLAPGFRKEPDPIPEGEPSKEPVTAVINDLEITVLGADCVREDGEDRIVFYYDVKNLSGEIRFVWNYEFEAVQDGEFLEPVWGVESIPEEYYLNFDIAPGRTLRCATIFPINPEGGAAGLRVSCSGYDNVLLYYADPRNPGGAPEPFAFDADPTVPEMFQELPEEAGDIKMEEAVFYKDEEGDSAVRFYFRFKNTSAEGAEGFYEWHNWSVFQDGISLPENQPDENEAEENNLWEEVLPGKDILCARSCKLRTGSPVVLVIDKQAEDWTETPLAAKIAEVPENAKP